ncbi:MAG: RNA polymerase sigma factor [Bacteroidales bacterium]
MEKYSIEALLNGLGKRDPVILNHIYEEYYPWVEKHVLNNSGTEDDAGDIFQETLVILFRKRKEGSLHISTSFRNYLIGTAKMLWLKELRRRRRSPVISAEVTDEESLAENISLEAEEKSRYSLYQKYFMRLAEDCRKILKWFYSKVPLAEIARRMGYKSENYARKRKFKCKEKLIEMIKNDPAYDED